MTIVTCLPHFTFCCVEFITYIFNSWEEEGLQMHSILELNIAALLYFQLLLDTVLSSVGKLGDKA